MKKVAWMIESTIAKLKNIYRKALTRNDAKDGFFDGVIDSKLPLTAILDNFFNDNTKIDTEDLELKSADDFGR